MFLHVAYAILNFALQIGIAILGSRIPGSRSFSSQKLVKIVVLCVLNDTIKKISRLINKIFYVRQSPTLCCAL